MAPKTENACKRMDFMELIGLLIPLLITTAYLGFCWTVLHRTVILRNNGLIDATPNNIAAIKSGVTTVSILVIALGLWPIRTLLVDIQAEEFFRMMKRRDKVRNGYEYHDPQRPAEVEGLNLATANAVSSAASLGIRETIVAVIRKQCSPHFTMAFIAGFIVMMASSLAPAALSVQEAFMDSGVMAFEVGAMPIASVANTSQFRAGRNSISQRMFLKLEEAASIIWAETSLNVNYSFSVPESNSRTSNSNSVPRYIVPLPVNLTPEISARWLTDVFVLRPTCTWHVTNLSTETYSIEDFTDLPVIPVNIPDLGIDLNIYFMRPELVNGNQGFEMRYCSTDSPHNLRATNSTTGDVALGGNAFWAIVQYYPNVTAAEFLAWDLIFNQTDIPTFGVMDEYGGILRYALLGCSPNLSIETVEIRNSGRSLTVFSPNNGQRFSPQENLDRHQGDFFFMSLFGELGDNAGPNIDVWRGQSLTQASLVFGWDQVRAYNRLNSSALPITWTPMPIANITEMYFKYVHSASQPYMTGTLGTAFVPGIISKPVISFTASRPHVVVSTILLMALNILNILAFFRSGKGEIFSLLRVARVLHVSNLPNDLARIIKEDWKEEGQGLERAFANASRNQVLVLDHKSEDSGGVGILAVRDREAP
ncbi:hypothetical protein AX16_011024 [Volvariella volvacea WC 439]|nr:hypothetical protein AX16_011024 [Volvariella volvacea WC 439]